MAAAKFVICVLVLLAAYGVYASPALYGTFVKPLVGYVEKEV
jgi:hypothetical protein